MRIASRLHQFSLGLAAVSFVAAGAASAQTLHGVNVRLDQNLDSQSATAGQPVTAKLQSSIKAESGFDLPRGTELTGKIASAKASANGGPSTLTIDFNSAKLKDGKQVPVKATVLAAYSGGESEDQVGPAPASVNADESVSQTPGALSDISLSAAAKNADSGTFTRSSGDIRLHAGTWLQVGVAPASSAGSTSAAE